MTPQQLVEILVQGRLSEADVCKMMRMPFKQNIQEPQRKKKTSIYSGISLKRAIAVVGQMERTEVLRNARFNISGKLQAIG